MLSRLTGAPYFPITPTFPALGAARRRYRFRRSGGSSSASRSTSPRYGPEAAEDRALVFELSEQVRDTIQEKRFENLVTRGSAFI